MDDLDPDAAGSLDDLAAALRRLHVRADRPTYRSLEEKTKHASKILPGTQLKQVRLTRSVISDMLLGRKLPGKAFLLTFVYACGVDIESDRRWENAWERLAMQIPDAAAEGSVEQLRQRLADADARADRAVEEAALLRREVVQLRQEADGLRSQSTNGQKFAPPGLSENPFWDVLGATEREILRSVASLRTFAAGATIMQQGESADYVIVLLGGKAKICIYENGEERIIAERGRGQLIGERGALQVSVRSATVIAVEMIYALVVKTKDFAEFLSANPRILDFVQDQSRDRGTYEPDKYVNTEEELFGSRGAASGTNAGASDGASARGGHTLKGENCTVVLTDVVAFGAHKRTDNDRLIIRQALSEMVQEAVQGLHGAQLEDRGDGILIVVPPKIPTATVLDRLLSVLPFSLDQHNRSERNPAQFQLRLSIDVGPVVSDAMGVSGEALIVAARLVEASALKEAFTGSTVRLGVIVSSFIYNAVVKHDQDQAYVASYAPVPIHVKESRITAWMKLIG